MNDLSQPVEVIVKGRKVLRPGSVKSTDHLEYCLASTKENLAHAHENKMKPCSVSLGVNLADTTAYTQYKEDISAGIKRPECFKCWNNEERGVESERQRGNKLWLNPEHGNSHTEIILSNKCNAACLYCNSVYSSKWKDYIDNSKTILPKTIQNSIDCFKFSSHQPNKREIEAAYQLATDLGADFTKMACIGVYGGEPGLSIIEDDHLGNVLGRFYNANELWDRTIRYDFNTSLNYSRNRCKQIIKYFKKNKDTFPNYLPVIQPSIECVNDLFEYVRHGNTFQNFDKNLDLFLAEEIFKIEIQVSLNTFSFKHLPDVIRYINDKSQNTQQDISITWRFVDWLPFFDLICLDNSFIKYSHQLSEYLQNNKIGIGLNNFEDILITIEKKLLQNVSDNHFLEALEFVNWIENERGVSLKDVNAELYDYFVNMSAKWG